jgi:uncharacterized repeat protein (TIGR03803 family)
MKTSRSYLLPVGALLLCWILPARSALAQGFKMIHGNTQGDAGPQTLIQNPGDGLFYGTCRTGGAHYPNGCVFKMDATGNLTVIHSFAGAPGDGSSPESALFLNSDGLFYGTTQIGGADNSGTFFKIDSMGGSYAFQSLPNPGICEPTGVDAYSSLFKANDGNFYVPIYSCGEAGEDGVIDLVDTSLTASRIAGFSNTGPFNSPQGHLLQGSDDNLYGTVSENPNISGNHGGIYRLGLGGGSIETVHAFALGEGLNGDTSSPLLLASDGNFWGTTLQATDLMGSVLFTGTIFKVAQDGTFQTVHQFNGADGRFPSSGLIQASDGYLYGATSAGGTAEYGVFFRMDLSGNYTFLANIYDTGIGAGPWSELLQASDGKLYGTTGTGGGPFGYGTIYTVDLSQTIGDITPSSGPAAGGTNVTLDGSGFVTGATVLVGAAATNVSIPDATHIDAKTASNNPGTIVDVRVTLPDTTVMFLYGGFFYDFLDVPAGDSFEPYVRKLVSNHVTAGCGGGDYCRNNPVLRKQMAVFALKAKYGAAYTPPPAVGIFTDVPASDPFAPWIEALHNLGGVNGCAPGPMYCPDSPVLRQQMPVFLLKTLLGSGYVPPACGGIFGDVPCPSLFADWIEDLVARGITAGCGGGDFCPINPVTRGQMAPFLVKTFGLP